MIDITIGGIHCKLSLLFPAVLLYFLYIDPSGLAVFGFLAAFIHESGHLLAAYTLHQQPCELSVSCFGMRLCFSALGITEHLLIALAGPAVNALAAILFYVLTENTLYAGLHLLIAVFNLLPVMPLDGGQAMRCLLTRFYSDECVFIIEKRLYFTVWIPLFIMSLVLLFRPPYNLTLLLVCVYLLFMRLFYNGN